MKIYEITQLDIHPDMYIQAGSNKHQVVAKVDPMEVLKLTTETESDIQHYLNNAQKLDKYNQYIKNKQNTLLPFLIIDSIAGKIAGHEGRHRCASVINAGGKEITVSLKLINFNKELKQKYGVDVAYKCKFEDFPQIIQSQYTTYSCNKNIFNVLLDGFEEVKYFKP